MMTDQQRVDLKNLADSIYNLGVLADSAPIRLAEGTLTLLACLEEAEARFYECVGGFKRDLQNRLDAQRKKNKRLTDELAATRQQLEQYKRDAERYQWLCDVATEEQWIEFGGYTVKHLVDQSVDDALSMKEEES